MQRTVLKKERTMSLKKSICRRGLSVLLLSVAFAMTSVSWAGELATKSHDWSAMREVLQVISHFKGKTEGNVQKIVQNALAGSPGYSIGEFELQYANGKSGEPSPNDMVRY